MLLTKYLERAGGKKEKIVLTKLLMESHNLLDVFQALCKNSCCLSVL